MLFHEIVASLKKACYTGPTLWNLMTILFNEGFNDLYI